MPHDKTEGCVCRACMGKNPMPEYPENYPPMGDYKWVLIGDHWEESRITEAGTLVIPEPDYYSTDTSKFLELLNTVSIAHRLDPKKISSIKSWDKVVAVHFN